MGIGSQEAWKIYENKIKYFTKALTDDSIFNNLGKLFDSEDFIHLIGNLVISDTIFSSLTLYYLFNLNLSDIIPANLYFSVELPTPEEFAKGTLIKLVPIKLNDLVPELSSVVSDPTELLKPEIRDAVKRSMITKCVYGQASYDNCYYDPVAVREFLRSSVLAFTKKWYDIRTARDMVAAAAKTLDINENIARNVFNRLSMNTSIKYSCATVDYAWVDISTLCEEETHSPAIGVVKFINYDLEVKEVSYEDMFDTHSGCIVEESVMDYCYIVGDDDYFKHPYIPGDDRVSKILERVVSNFRSRIPTTAFAIANYQTPEERSYPFINERMEIYATNRGFSIRIENLAKNIVQSIKPDVSPVELRMYQNAALELYGVSSQHKWGLDMQRAMTQDELHDYWIRKWISQGLDPEILEAIWSRVSGVAQTYSNIRVSNRFKFIRERIKLVK